MTVATSSAGERFAAAVARLDFDGARGQLHPDIDFRAMTPNRIWEADEPAGVEDVLRTWLDKPDEDVESIAAAVGEPVGDTQRVSWFVHGSDAEGPFVFEQQVFARERDGQIVWLRLMCSGHRRQPAGPSDS